MDIVKVEELGLEQLQPQNTQVHELSELDLALIGGGQGDISLG